jgi:ribonuclease R
MKKPFQYTKPKNLPSNILRQAILDLLQRNQDKNFSISQIKKILNIGNNKDSIADAVAKVSGQLKLVTKKDITPRNDSFKTSQTYEGVVDMTRTGAGYIVSKELEDDIYVSPRDLNSAFNGDRVLVKIITRPHKRRPEGEIIKIIERATENFIGTFKFNKRYAIVEPDLLGVKEIFVEPNHTKNANEGDKVVVKITQWPSGKLKHPIGEVTLILGKPGSSDIAMKSILINNGFNIEFPEEVIEESEKISEIISASEIARRRDFRKITTITIDPEDAKDFDDALSIEKLKNGNLEIGVHIADVSHYIHPNTALDKEAYLRSTSVYLVDRVCPMLPEKLSNVLCSLRPDEDKLTFSAVFEFDESLKLVNTWIGKSIIHSIRRFTYEEAQERLETKTGDFADELNIMNTIAKKLKKGRFKDGAINFESDEVRFRLDENAVPISVYTKERKDAHMLVEDFMLLANKEVAKFIAKKDDLEIPFVYRIHDLPDIARLEEFARFAAELGVKMNLDTPKAIAQSLNELSKAAEENALLKLLTPIAIRTMAKAEYSTNNIGHYGLAFTHYSHFTSPIRRYSDVMAHRILFENLTKISRVDKELTEAMCKHISKQERKANDAERESIKYKQVEYMKFHLGEIFDGVVSGFIDKGFFVELVVSRCEGLISFAMMPEAYEIEPGRLKAVGKNSNTVIKMGDKIKVKVLRTDLERKEIEFELM